MVKRLFLFFLGFLLGFAFDLVPAMFEVLANTNVCIESCPSTLRGVSLAIYAFMPFAWGILLATAIGKTNAKRILITSLLASSAIMVLLTWFLYKHQHP